MAYFVQRKTNFINYMYIVHLPSSIYHVGYAVFGNAKTIHNPTNKLLFDAIQKRGRKQPIFLYHIILPVKEALNHILVSLDFLDIQ